MFRFSIGLTETVRNFFTTSGETSQRLLDALEEGDHKFTLTFLRGSVQPICWGSVLEFYEQQKDPNDLHLVAMHQAALAGLIHRCEEELEEFVAGREVISEFQ